MDTLGIELTLIDKSLFIDLILYVPVNNFSVMLEGSSWVEPVLSRD